MLEAGGHHVLVGGNIGLALSAQVDESTDDTIHVVEASSFQLESDRHVPSVDRGAAEFLARPSRSPRRLAEYAAAKARIFANQTPDDWAVLNADDEASQALAQDARSQRLLFAVERAARRRRRRGGRRDRAARRGGGDAGAGAAVGGEAARAAPAGRRRWRRPRSRRWPASSPEAMTRAVEGFTGLEHALEPVAEIGGVRFVNDSKATNIEAALRAIRELRHRAWS